PVPRLRSGPDRLEVMITIAPPAFTSRRTVATTTFRRDATPASTPVPIAVCGVRAVLRSFANAGKTPRPRRYPTLEVHPSTFFGRPLGPAVRGTARLLDGEEAKRAAWLLRRRHPFLHGVVVPLAHRIGRRRTGRTVHFELVTTG